MSENESIIQQKKVAQLIRNMEEELEELQKSQRAAGWAQRNALIEHVYSNYDKQEKVIAKKEKWEQITFRCNLLSDIIDLLLPYRDLYGLYDIPGMKKALEQQLRLAEEKNEFEIAQVIFWYKNQLEGVE